MEIGKIAREMLERTKKIENSLIHWLPKIQNTAKSVLAETSKQGYTIGEILQSGIEGVTTTLQKSTKEILAQGKIIERACSQGFEKLSKASEDNQAANQFIKDGLKGHKDRQGDTPAPGISSELIHLFLNDKEMRWPHRRIVEFLCQQYDFQKKRFTEVHQSEIVRKAKISRSMVKGYLTFLMDKGLIEKRHQADRIFYRMNRGFGMRV